MHQRYEQRDTRGVDRLGQRTIQLWTIDQGNPFSMGFEERLETGKIIDGT
jgi:anti-sigma-K factor RskA